MPRINNNKNIKINSPAKINNSRLGQNKNTMRREILFPLIVGIILGVLVMIFWQFTTRLNVQQARVVQLEQVTMQNSQALNDIVAFINNATNSQGQGGATGE